MYSMGLTRVVKIHGANNNAPMFFVEVMQSNKREIFVRQKAIHL